MEGAVSFILLLGFGFVSGLRHGIDIDHIAAITDIVSSQKRQATGFFYTVLYAAGHGIMVIALGAIILLIGHSLPEEIDYIFGKIVGVTLILLGLYVLVSVVRDGRNFQMKSRWMLVFDALQSGWHKLLHNFELSHKHPQLKEEKYGGRTAFGIGLIHGVGAETPTQIAALAVLWGIGGGLKGFLFLFLFVLGIFISNMSIALFTSFGFVKAKQKNNVYLAIAFLTALFSLVVGVLFLRD